MGFSLRRALAGAVAGGAHAAVELADHAIKSAEHDRRRALEFEQQNRLMETQAQNAEARARRAYEFKEKRETDKIERYGKFLSATTADLKKEGIKPESADGQARIAAALSTNGFPAEGDKYQDNYFKLLELKTKDEQRKAEQTIRLEMARDRRAGTAEKASTKAGAASSKADEKELKETINSFAFKTKSREGGSEEDSTARDLVANIVDKGRSQGASAGEMNSRLLALKPAFNAERAEKPRANGADIFRSTWEKVNTKPADKPAQPAVQPAAAERKVTPSIFNNGPSRRGASGGWDSPPAQPASGASGGWDSPPARTTSAAGIPVNATPSRVGSLPMSRNFGDEVVDFAVQGANTLTGSGANWDQMNRDISKPRNTR